MRTPELPCRPLFRVLLRFFVPGSLAALLLGMEVPRAEAANLTWSGAGGNSSWSAGANWAGSAPVANDALFFAGSTGLANDNNLTANTTFAGVTFNSGAGEFTLSGNAITLNGTVTNNSTSNQTINLAMIMDSARTFASLNGNLSVGGTLSGTGGLTKTGNSTLTLSAANAYAGLTTVSAGTLKLGVANAISAGNNATVAGAGVFDLNGNDQTLGLLNNGGNVTNSGALKTLTIGNGSTGAGRFTGAMNLVWNQAATGSSITGSTLGMTGNLTLNANGAGTIGFTTANHTGTITNSGSGSGSVTITGVIGTNVAGVYQNSATSVLALNGANTFTSGLNILQGTVRVGGTTGLGAGLVTIGSVGNSAVLDLNGGSRTINSLATAGTAGNQTIGNSAGTAATLNYTGATTSAFGGVIQDVVGTGTSTTGLTLNNVAARLTLSGNNTYSGLTTITAGVLNIRSNTALGSTANGTTVANGAALEMQNEITVGAETLTLNGTGVASGGALRNVSGNNTYQGNIILARATRINSDSGTLTLSTGTLTGAFGLTVGGVGNTTVSRVIGTGTGTLTKDGTGTFTLSAANTYTGLTTVSAGTLVYGINDALSTGAVRVNGGTLDIQSFTDTVGAVTLTTGNITGTTGVLSATSLTFNGTGTASANLGGNSTVTKSGAGTTTILSGNNTFSRNVTVSSGILSIRSSTALGTTANGTTVANGAALEMQNDITVGAETLTLNGMGVASGGALRSVSGNNTYQGNIILTGASRINSDSGTLTLSTGTLTGAFGLTVGGGGNTTISRVIGTGTGTLTKDGAGTLTLSGNNTYTGTTTVSGGKLLINGTTATSALNITSGNLTLGSASRLVGASPTVSVSAGAFLATAGVESIRALSGAGSVNLGGTLTVNVTSGNSTFAGLLSGAGGLNKTGTALLTLTSNNTYAGGTTVAAGELHVSASSGLGSGNVTLNGTGGTPANLHYGTANSTLSVGAFTMNGNSTLSLVANGAVQSSGAVNINGTGNFLSLAGNTWNLGTNTLLSGTSLTLGGGATVSLTGAAIDGNTLALGSSIILGRTSYTFNSTATSLTLLLEGNLHFDLVWTGNATSQWNTTDLNWEKSTAGVNPVPPEIAFVTDDDVYFSNAAASSPITVDAGGVHAGGMYVSNTTGNITFDGGAISVNDLFKTGSGSLNINSTLALDGSGGDPYGMLDNSGSGDVTINGALTNGEILQSGNGTLTLAAINSYSGGSVVTGGTVVLGANDALGTGLLTVSGGTVNAGSYSQTLGAVTLVSGSITGNGSLTGTSYSVEDGVIDVSLLGSGGLTKSTGGTVTLTGNNSYSGGTIVSGGTLIGTTSSLQGSMTNDAAVVFNQSANGTYSGTMSGSGSLAKEGSGTATLSGTNTYTGPTNVNGGTLLVTGSTGSGAVSVASGATLSGTGTIGGVTTVEGTIAPGDGGIGTLNVANTLTWKGAGAGGSNTDWIFELGAGNTSDLLSITGDFNADVSLGSVFRFNFAGSTEEGTFTLVSWSGASTGFDSGSFSYDNLGALRSGAFNFSANSLEFTVIAVPEPSTWISMVALAVGGALFVRRRPGRVSACDPVSAEKGP